MKITNRMGLPQPIVDAVAADQHDREGATYSVTELIKPPHMLTLERTHEGEIEEDASDRIFALLGRAVHSILESGGNEALSEERLTAVIDGIPVSGALDHYVLDGGVLSDYKVTSVWAMLRPKPEWVAQTNMYAHLLRAHGHTPTVLRIVAILRDWSKPEARRDPSYPQSQVVVVDQEAWTPEATEAYMRERVRLHEAPTHPICASEERWERPTTYAVKKPGAAKALRVLPTMPEAEAWIAQNPKAKGADVETRPGLNVRCVDYCNVAPWCSFAQSLKGAAP